MWGLTWLRVHRSELSDALLAGAIVFATLWCTTRGYAAPKPPPPPIVVIGTGYPTCNDFARWQDAQAALAQYPRLDADKDGIACESNPGAPK